MKILLNEMNGVRAWVSEGYEPAYRPLDLSDAGRIEGETNWQHGRSVFLTIPEGKTITAKGVGWPHNWVPGWCPEMGSFGILPLRAAMHEKEVSLYLLEHGIECAKPLAIFQKLEIMSKDGKLVSSGIVLDLDGSPAQPCVYYYFTESILRCSELGTLYAKNKSALAAILTRLHCNDVEEYIKCLSDKMAVSSAFFHTHDGHNYSASSHNLTALGKILDFEYAVVENRHWKKELCEEQETWRDKELYGWVMLLAEVMDCLEYTGNRRKMLADLIRLYLELGGDSNLATSRMVL